MIGSRIRSELQSRGVADLASRDVPLPAELHQDREKLLASWNNLPRDEQMGDGGTYRFRRYSRLLLDTSTSALSTLEGTSIYQPLEDNALNGGKVRTFEALEPEIRENLFLHHLIWFDWACLPVEPTDSKHWAVGVHQVRIQAFPDSPGKPSPEGLHIDGERFTVQHLIGRENVQGGVFSAYDQAKRPVFHWLQLKTWETVFFTGSTWHDATPIACRDDSRPGYRDILLIDFDPVSA